VALLIFGNIRRDGATQIFFVSYWSSIPHKINRVEVADIASWLCPRFGLHRDAVDGWQLKIGPGNAGVFFISADFW